MIIRNKKYQPENKVALHYQRKDNASTQVQKKKRGFHFHLSASEMTETTKQVSSAAQLFIFIQGQLLHTSC